MRVSFQRFAVGSLMFGFLAIAASSVCGQADVTIQGGGNNATFGGKAMLMSNARAIKGAPMLDGAFVFDLTVTTTSDILLVNAEFVETAGMNALGGWYNFITGSGIGYGSDVNPPSVSFIGFSPELYFETWVTTPGSTAVADANTLNGPPGANWVTHFDSTDDGPQTEFTFAQITLIPDAQGNASLVLRGTMQTKADPRPVFDDFEYRLSVGVPEPASMGLVLTALLGGISIIRRKRIG